MVLAGVGNTLLVPVGRVGIGDNTPDIGTGGQLKLDVAGNIGATKYCDAAGNNCKAITEVGGSNVQNIYHGWIPTSGAFGSAGPVNLGAHDFCYFTNLTWSGAAGQCRLYQSSGVWYMQSYEGARCGATCADII